MHPPRISRSVRSTTTCEMVGRALSSCLTKDESASTNGMGFVLGPPGSRKREISVTVLAQANGCSVTVTYGMKE